LPPNRYRDKDDAYRNFGYAFSVINVAAKMPNWVQEKRLKEISDDRSAAQKLFFLRFRSLRDAFKLLKASESLTISVLLDAPSLDHEMFSWLLMMKINTHLADVAKDLQKYLVKKSNEKDDFYLTQIKEKDPELLELSEEQFLNKVIDAGDKLKLGYKNISLAMDTRRRVLTAHALFRLNKTAQAAKIFEGMIEGFTITSPEFILPVIESFHQTGRLALAQKWVKKALVAWPKNEKLNVDSALIKMDILRKNGKDKKAETIIDNAIKNFSGNAKLLEAKDFLEISRLIKSGKNKEAKEKILKAIKQWPDSKIFKVLKNRLGMH